MRLIVISANTGQHNGAIRLVELALCRALQWIICIFHMLELPLRNLFCFLDGSTDGPLGPNGPIGRAIKNLNKNLRPFVDFVRIQSNLPDIRELLKGQEDLIILYDLVKGIESGIIDPIYLLKEMPNISNARWRTTFIRILRLYVQTPAPSEELKILVNFIIKVWFANFIDKP